MSAESRELNGAPEVRREQMVRAALEVIQERGFPETRISDVAQRAGVSPTLVIYYFGTKDNLLTEAMRYSEDAFYELGARRMEAVIGAKARLEEIVALTCLPTAGEDVTDSWTLWLDLWAQATRHPAVARVREEFDEHWRETLRSIVREGQASGEFGAIDADDFAVGFSALLDGLAIQIALEDPAVDGRRAFELSMRVAAAELGFDWSPPGHSPTKPRTGKAAPRPPGARARR
ncbi:MAG TPA: TetR family transcriptional regulator C-terminal domain-containing protein [Acidimicrobiales bacterium]|nr:TetR family transcriptional regulator C-terminal domain-containing protein [Acidimicrobiales bacterium]